MKVNRCGESDLRRTFWCKCYVDLEDEMKVLHLQLFSL